MRRLLLVRHGETVWNEIRRLQGATDVPLSERGRAQSRALGLALRDHRVGAAYASSLERARETAALALGAAGIPVVPLDELRELSLGEWEGCTTEEIRNRDGDPYLAWVRAPVDCAPPGAEPLDAVCRRIVPVVERIGAAHPGDEDVLVVTHGGIISVYACHLLGCSFNALWRLRVDNASLTVVAPPRVVTLNDTRHLEGRLEPSHLVREGAASADGAGLTPSEGARRPLRYLPNADSAREARGLTPSERAATAPSEATPKTDSVGKAPARSGIRADPP